MFISRTAEPLIPPTRGHTLWIDGCGGFRLLTGARWSVGGSSAGPDCWIALQADWPRQAGFIVRQENEYFWEDPNGERRWLRHQDMVPVKGAAVLVLGRPSPLSQSVTLTLASPHRFAGHINAVVLVQDTVLIGPGTDSHIQYHGLAERIVLIAREGCWFIKCGKSDAVALETGDRFQNEVITMSLEEA